MKQQTLFDYVAAARHLGPLDTQDRAELVAVLGNNAVRKLLVQIWDEQDAVVGGALGWNLMTPAGIADAAISQGRARGIRRTLDIIFDAATQESDQ